MKLAALVKVANLVVVDELIKNNDKFSFLIWLLGIY